MAFNGAVPAAWAVESSSDVVAEGADPVTPEELVQNVDALDQLVQQDEQEAAVQDEQLKGVAAEEPDPDQVLPLPEEDVEEIELGRGTFGARTLSAKVAVSGPETQVAYAYTLSDGTWSSVQPASGSYLRADGIGMVPYSGSQMGCLLVFVRPYAGSLIMGIGATGAGNIFSIDQPVSQSTNCYPGADGPVAEARRQGYVAYFGWSFGTSRLDLETQVLTAPVVLSAQMERVDGSAKAAPGDQVRFRLEVSSQVDTSGLPVSGGQVEQEDTAIEVTVNGKAAEAQARPDEPGVFDVFYTVTPEDVAANQVEAQVEATVAYRGSVAKGTAAYPSTVVSRATTTQTVKAQATLAKPYGVTYVYSYDEAGANAERPDAVAPAPVDTATHYEDKAVAVLEPTQTSVAVREGTWTFEGWKLTTPGSAIVNNRAIMVEGGLRFEGQWHFTPATTYQVSYGFEGFDAMPAALQAVLPETTSGHYAQDVIQLPDLGPVQDVQKNERGEAKQGTWVFQGWHVDGTDIQVKGDLKVTGNVHLVGSWEWVVPERTSTPVLTGYRGVYDSMGHGVQLEGLEEGDVVTYTMATGGSEELGMPGRTRAVQTPEWTTAGVYEVTARVSNPGYKDDAVLSCVVEIAPRPVKIVVDDATWTPGEPLELTGSVEMASLNDTEERGLLDRLHLGTVTYKRDTNRQEPGVYKNELVPTFVANGNYAIEVVPGTLTVLAPETPSQPGDDSQTGDTGSGDEAGEADEAPGDETPGDESEKDAEGDEAGSGSDSGDESGDATESGDGADENTGDDEAEQDSDSQDDGEGAGASESINDDQTPGSDGQGDGENQGTHDFDDLTPGDETPDAPSDETPDTPGDETLDSGDEAARLLERQEEALGASQATALLDPERPSPQL